MQKAAERRAPERSNHPAQNIRIISARGLETQGRSGLRCPTLSTSSGRRRQRADTNRRKRIDFGGRHDRPIRTRRETGRRPRRRNRRRRSRHGRHSAGRQHRNTHTTAFDTTSTNTSTRVVKRMCAKIVRSPSAKCFRITYVPGLSMSTSAQCAVMRLSPYGWRRNLLGRPTPVSTHLSCFTLGPRWPRRPRP